MTSDERNRERLAVAYHIAENSSDPSTQNGAYIMHEGEWRIMSGLNGPTSGYVMTDMDWERPRKYLLVEHAERNAIYRAANHGDSCKDAIMVAAWASCSDCARAIVQSGIGTLIRHARPCTAEFQGSWQDSIDIGDKILKAGGVSVIDVYGPIPGAPKVRWNGRLWDPSI